MVVKKLIVYDASCPMCRIYTKGMVAADTTGNLSRIGNNELTQKDLLARLDRQRARHEIPLIDLDGGETLYGVDTWIHAIGHRNKQIKNLLSLNWLKAVLQKVYAFISYNRRIIITSAPGRWNLLDLQPDFRSDYRLAFILVVFSLIGVLFSSTNFSIWLPAAMALVVAQLIITCLYVFSAHADTLLQTMLDYAGHLGMSLLVGGIISAIGVTVGWSGLVLSGYALIIGQHFIRTYRLGLSPWLSVCFTVLAFLLLRLS